MKLFLITGTSKGLGYHLLQTALHANDHVVSITRNITPGNLPAEQRGLWQVQVDLASDIYFEDKIEAMFKHLKLDQYSHIVLINNAAVVEPIGPSDQIDNQQVQSNIVVNLQAPMMLTKKFLGLVKDTSGKIVTVNVSSGAAYRPIVAWSAYCATKAGLNMYTQCLAKEYLHDSRYHFYNFSPGIMDTDMQEQIRSKSKEQFSRVDDFIQYQKTGRLRDPKLVAQQIYKLVSQAQDFSKVDYDIEEFI